MQRDRKTQENYESESQQKEGKSKSEKTDFWNPLNLAPKYKI